MEIVDKKNGTALRGLTEYEYKLEKKILTWLKKTHPLEVKLVKKRFKHLMCLEKAVFSYPSIRDTEFLKGIIRDEECLADSLKVFSKSSPLLHIPSKVVAMKGFLVAKYHAFSLLLYLLNEKKEWQAQVRNVTFSVISTLITEEVYFSCLDDTGFSKNTKLKLADDLISLWDSGADIRGLHHLSALSSLWIARDAAPPSFGTMDGNTELLRITMDLEEDWREFLVAESSSCETKWALEEFVFGLSWEEIQKIRFKLIQNGISAINYDQIRSYLDSKPAYSVATESDPRAFYDFFIERRDVCNLRKRMNSPGPKHTLEEIFLKHRIITEQTSGHS